VQVGLRGCLIYGENRVDDIRCELLGEGAVELRGQRCAGDGQEKFAVNLLLELELIKELAAVSAMLSAVALFNTPSRPLSSRCRNRR
jgi:hypothetical protein